ncbi:MAG: Gfo/Idh/MocA family oxidoreductase [Pirellulaceae bacterium]|nr:Gfo/Idh/MocA family oxidoreductase [Pirellulaceae bacterium]
MIQISRRSALKASVAAGVGYWTGGSLLAREESPNEKLNIAVIGLGGQGGSNLKGVASQNIVALCDVDDQRAGNAYQRFPKAKKYADYRRMFDQMDQQIDAVVVSTPDHTHFHPSMIALDLGKHLYCEKPMAHSVWEVRQMTQLADKKGVATQLGVQRHTIANVHRVVELIQSGAIGDVTECHCWVGGDRGMPAAPKGTPAIPAHLDWDLWLGPAASRSYSPDYCPYKWRFWWDFGTGETGNWGCHILDIPYWALGLTFPNRVDASGPEIDAQRTPKSMASRMVFPASEGRPEVNLHWYQAAQGPPILKQHNLSHQGNNTLFIGSDGMLLCGFGQRKLYPEDKFADYAAPEKSIPDSPGFHREWFEACKGGTPATCDFSYSGPLSETVLLANAAYRANGGFDWNAQSLAAKGNPQADQYLFSKFRKGWGLNLI